MGMYADNSGGNEHRPIGALEALGSIAAWVLLIAGSGWGLLHFPPMAGHLVKKRTRGTANLEHSSRR